MLPADYSGNGRESLSLEHKRHHHLHLHLLEHFFGESQSPYQEDAQGTLWRGPHGEELRSPVNS